MNKTQLQKDIAEMEARLQSMKEQVNKPENKAFTPEVGEMYWCLSGTGSPCVMKWGESYSDPSFLQIGNIFPSKKEAEKHVRLLRIYRKLAEYGGRRYYDSGTRNNYILAEDGYVGNVQSSRAGEFYFNTQEDAKEAYKSLTEEEHALLFYG